MEETYGALVQGYVKVPNSLYGGKQISKQGRLPYILDEQLHQTSQTAVESQSSVSLG